MADIKLSPRVSDARVYVKKGEARQFKQGGPWIYENEIDRVEGDFTEGEILEVLDYDGYFLGMGYMNRRSVIAIRMLTRYRKETVDTEFCRRRVRRAIDYRRKVVDMGSCRLIFGEADGIPGLTVDKYEDVLVVESLSLGADLLKGLIVALLKEELVKDGLPIRGVYERSEARERAKEGLPTRTGYLGESFDPKVRITENGVLYEVDVAEGQKTGFFLDQKLNRAAIRPFAAGGRVLDCFTHTGSFGLNAALAGASSVLAVDASETAIAQARRNVELNGVADRMNCETADVFELLPALERSGQQYDLVILDPPAFTKSRASVKQAVKGYREVNRRGMKLVRDGGYLATCSCSHFMDPELFARTIHDAARDAHVQLRQVEFRTQAPDHPILWGASESYYLKFYIFQVLK